MERKLPPIIPGGRDGLRTLGNIFVLDLACTGRLGEACRAAAKVFLGGIEIPKYVLRTRYMVLAPEHEDKDLRDRSMRAIVFFCKAVPDSDEAVLWIKWMKEKKGVG